MSTLVYPDVITPDTTADATQVESNFVAVATVVNGNLDATNVSTAAPVAQTSAALNAGSASTLALSDHKHTIQCVEQLSSDPSSGNFNGRMYFNTSTNKVRQLLSGVWTTVTGITATDGLPLHQTQHGPTGDDVFSPPMCKLERAGTGGISNTTLTPLSFGTGSGTEIYDTDTMHDMTTNPTRITFTHAGVYAVKANVVWAANGTGSRWAAIQLNGTGQCLADSIVPGVGSGDNPANSLSCDYKASANDYVELVVYQNSTGTLNVLGTGTALAIGSRNACCGFSARWTGAGV